MSVSVLFYVQHLLGVGHLARASLVAEALVEQGARVIMVIGGRPVAGFPGPGINVVELPPVSAGPGGFSNLVDKDSRPIDDSFKQKRSNALLGCLESCDPDIVLIEAYPFGRRQMRFELQPLLATARRRSKRPLVACSVRDILQERSAEKTQQTLDEISAAFDLVLVHGDPKFAGLDETFPPAADIAGKVRYTGIVSAAPGNLEGEAFDVVVSAGGGIAGEILLRTAITSKPLCSLSTARWCLITGPNLDPAVAEDINRNTDPGISICVSRPDFRALLAQAKISISQAGYNTAADILRAGCRSVMVPFASGGETEQSLRARKLAERSLVGAIEETDMTPVILAWAIDTRMKLPPIGTAHDIDLQGAVNAAQTLIQEATSRG